MRSNSSLADISISCLCRSVTQMARHMSQAVLFVLSWLQPTVVDPLLSPCTLYSIKGIYMLRLPFIVCDICILVQCICCYSPAFGRKSHRFMEVSLIWLQLKEVTSFRQYEQLKIMDFESSKLYCN